MTLGRIELRGDEVFCHAADVGKEARFQAADLARMSAWADRYDAASRLDQESELLEIGREMFAWLNEAGWASAWSQGHGERILEIHVEGRGNEREAIVLDAPWELLSTDRGPLAGDDLQLFVVARQIGPSGEPWPPVNGDLQLMFLAAAVKGQSELAFEDEEAAILEATGGRRTHLVVEETGALDPLTERLTSDEAPFEALHLSCHGTIAPEKGPMLLLETIEGDAHLVGPGALVEALGPSPPPLVVLSACRTAERGTGLAAPFARQLATMTANVVGWDGSVYDRDAIDFAAEFYSQLEARSSVPRAAAHARRALLRLRAQSPERGLHWHLARVYLGRGGGGPLCAAKLPERRRAADTTPRAFLDKARGRVPVASRSAFVGRRRALQSILRAYRDGASGVLIHGMGAVGKSSAAARIANRLSLPTCVIFEHYDGLTIFDSLVDMLPPAERQGQRATWRDTVLRDEAMLSDALEGWLQDRFDKSPILVIIDDLEQILETPAPGDVLTGVMPEYRAALGAVLKAFGRAPTKSRLLVTSRYDFSLPDGRGGDLAADLIRQPLIAMPAGEREKQLRAAERIAGREDAERDAQTSALLARALDAGGGNPGLQDALTKPILAGELEAAEKALSQIAHFREEGVPPAEIQALIDSGAAKDSDNALIAFLARISLQTYRDALTEDELKQLTAATLFSEDIPVPRSTLTAAGAALGCTAGERAIERLVALGLVDDWGEIDGQPHVAANTLARPLATFNEGQRPAVAEVAAKSLADALRRPDGAFPRDPRSHELASLAMEAKCSPELIEAAVRAGALWLARVHPSRHEALRLIAAAHDLFPRDYQADPDFLRFGAECADELGEVEILDSLLARPTLDHASSREGIIANAGLNLRRAARLTRLGSINEAELLIRKALQDSQETGEERMAAFASGQIADILEQRGETDEALRIRREEELPVYERLGELRSRSVTLQKIASCLLDLGGGADERIHEIHAALAEAFDIALRMQLPDGIGFVGVPLGQVLVAMGRGEEALAVLDLAEAAFRKLGNSDGAAFAEQLRRRARDIE